MVYYKKRAKDTAHFARVAQWWSIALPRRGSRVRIPSRAFFNTFQPAASAAFLFSPTIHFSPIPHFPILSNLPPPNSVQSPTPLLHFHLPFLDPSRSPIPKNHQPKEISYPYAALARQKRLIPHLTQGSPPARRFHLYNLEAGTSLTD